MTPIRVLKVKHRHKLHRADLLESRFKLIGQYHSLIGHLPSELHVFLSFFDGKLIVFILCLRVCDGKADLSRLGGVYPRTSNSLALFILFR
jgi:hypothetical protein